MLARRISRDGQQRATLPSDLEQLTAKTLADNRNHGEGIEPEDRSEALGRMKTYISWFNHEIFRVDDSGKSQTIIVVPQGSPSPFYRDLTVHDGQLSLPFCVVCVACRSTGRRSLLTSECTGKAPGIRRMALSLRFLCSVRHKSSFQVCHRRHRHRPQPAYIANLCSRPHPLRVSRLGPPRICADRDHTHRSPG